MCRSQRFTSPPHPMELKAYITMSGPTLCVCVSVLLIVKELMYKLGAHL